jgi:hypothetical protein
MNHRRYRDVASVGKRLEYFVIAELLRRKFDVYVALVDDQGIDCIVRLDDARYVDVQIKARSEKAKQWNLFAAMSFEARDNLYFIFYTEPGRNFWVVPSKDVRALGVENKTGRNVGEVSLTLPKGGSGRGPRFARYKNDGGFDLLRSCGEPGGGRRRTVRRE